MLRDIESKLQLPFSDWRLSVGHFGSTQIIGSLLPLIHDLCLLIHLEWKWVYCCGFNRWYFLFYFILWFDSLILAGGPLCALWWPGAPFSPCLPPWCPMLPPPHHWSHGSIDLASIIGRLRSAPRPSKDFSNLSQSKNTQKYPWKFVPPPFFPVRKLTENTFAGDTFATQPLWSGGLETRESSLARLGLNRSIRTWSGHSAVNLLRHENCAVSNYLAPIHSQEHGQ